jgi:hypothetical protein
MESIVQDISNIGFTLLCIVVGVVIVNWLDRNVFNKKRKK